MATLEQPNEVDVLVVGAGPAGSTTARFCAGKDVNVLIIDRRKEIGYPVQCGELLPHAEEMCSIFPRSADLADLFALEDACIRGECTKVDMISPRGRIYRLDFRSHVLDRRAYDKHLARLAVEQGARLESNQSLVSLKDGIAKTTMGLIKPKVIVGADGPNSRTAREVGLPIPSELYPAVTCQAEGSFEPEVKMYFGRCAPGGYAWIIPKGHEANVGLGFNPRLLSERPGEVFARFMTRLDCRYSDVAMGFVPMSGPVDRTVSGNAILVGDAAGHVMATNGGGIPTAMMAGRIAGRLIKEHLRNGTPLQQYETRWRELLDKPLKKSVSTRSLADLFYPSDSLLGLTMFILGRRGLDRAIRCKPLFL
jgi:digeranylgeranylglycerophospholipid reductase